MSDQNKEIAKEITLALIENKRLALHPAKNDSRENFNDYVAKEVSRVYKHLWEAANNPEN